MMNVVITSATPLSSKQLNEVKDAVTKKYGKAEFSTVIDPSLIGGLTIALGSRLLDGSIKTKLEQLRKQITQVR
jgi:F-type H+-transporting ATPase subunit delta